LGDGKSKAFSIIVNKIEEPEILNYLGRISTMMGVPFKLTKTTSKKMC